VAEVPPLDGIDDLAAAVGGLSGRRVFVRADLNVPLSTADDGTRTIGDDGRIRASLPTVRKLRDAGAVVVLASHLGRPKGAPEAKYSLAPVAARLSELLGAPVVLADDTCGVAAVAAVAAATPGSVVLLENLRFEPGETSKDAAERGRFADRLVGLLGSGAAYVGDGFGAVHRAHASVVDLPDRLPHGAGGLVQSEVAVLRRLTTDPARPFAVVLGGSKVSDKLKVIDSLLGILTAGDKLLVGGGMVFTFLAAQGHGVGKSLLEADQIDTVSGYLQRAAAAGIEVLLPSDIVVADRFAADADVRVVSAEAVGPDDLGLDIGPDSAKAFAAAITEARTVFWNGPMGVFELAPFAAGTRAVAQALVDATSIGALTVVGGGDSAAAVRSLGFADDTFGHISTGGGASLEFLEGATLPGIAALERPYR
jgi:phosphoglycerate kinase